GAGWAEPLGANPLSRDAQLQQVVGRRLDQERRSTYVGSQARLHLTRDVLQHGPVDPTPVSGPTGWRLAGIGIDNLYALPVILQHLQFVRVQHVVRGSDAVEEEGLDRRACRDPVSDHRHQRHHPGAAADQQERTAERDIPDEVAANWPTQLELIAFLNDVVQIRRDLAAFDPFDRELHNALSFGFRTDRVASLCL